MLTADNPWLTQPSQVDACLQAGLPPDPIPRAALASVRWQDSRRAHLVVGPRQAGKTTLLRTWLRERGQPALRIDCEQALIQQWCTSAPLFLRDLAELVHEPCALLFDEAQFLEEAGLLVKGLVDRDYPAPVLVTGSSSWHLGARTRESLAGRATRTRLLPLSLAEVCHDLADRPPALRARAELERLERHLIVGGYPDVWLSDRPGPLLTELVEAFVLRDASDLFQIQRPDAFRRLMRLVAGQVGSLVNLSEWASLLGISRNTVSAYLEILEGAHVLAIVPPFAGGKRSELTSRPKVFFVDTGLRNRMVGQLSPWSERGDRGALLENWVLTELLKVLPSDCTVHFWRSQSGAEVDFVIVTPDRLIAVEVKAGALARPKVSRSARSFLKAYAPSRLLVVQLGAEQQITVEGVPVRFVHPRRLAVEIDRARTAAQPS